MLIKEQHLNTYRFKFNWHGEVHTLETTAKNISYAKRACLAKLSKVIKQPIALLNKIYDGNLDNYKSEVINYPQQKIKITNTPYQNDLFDTWSNVK